MEFSQIAVLFVVAAVFGVAAKALKQPLLVGYLFAGMILSYFGFFTDTEVFSGLGKIGVTLLLFLVGLEIEIKELPSVGKTALVAGLGQIIFTSSIGYILARFLGFGSLEAIYVAVALTFSSTIIIIKLLSEKNDLSSLYGKISVGILLVQDVVVVLILVILAGLGEGNMGPLQVVFMGVKALALIALVWVTSKRLLPRLFERFFLQSQELILIVSIAWALGVAAFVAGPLGFSLEIGGFLAGLSLSNLPEHLQIASKTRPLRDFFLTIFFLLLGARLVVGNIGVIIAPSLVLSIFVLVGNPLIVLAILGLMGYRRRTSFFAGLTVAQISEFSFILVAMGAALGHLTDSTVSTVIVVGVITMTLSTYMILGSDKIYKKIKTQLGIFEKKKTKEQIAVNEVLLSDHAILIGAGKSGRSISKYLTKKKIPVLIIDFNPKVVNQLTAKKTPVIFGDVTDIDILNMSNMEKSRVVVSTLISLHDNLTVLEYLRNLKRKPLFVATATSRGDAIKLYEKGAGFVVVPQETAGEYVRHVFKVYGVGSERITKLGKSHFNRLVYSSLSSGV